MTAADAVRYTGPMTIPIDLFTQEGTKIEKRKYELEVSSDGSLWTLSFLLEGKDRVSREGQRCPLATLLACQPSCRS